MHHPFDCNNSPDELRGNKTLFNWIYPLVLFRLYGAGIILPLFLSVLLVGCGQKKATREHSRKVLKAFDYEVIRTIQKLGNTAAFDALLQVRKLPGVQLPLLTSNDTLQGTETSIFNIKRASGIYQYRSADSLPVKVAASDSLVILFNDQKSPSHVYRLVFPAYQEKLTALGMVFPEVLEADVYRDNHWVGSIRYRAKFRYDMPEDVDLKINAGRVEISFRMKTVFRRKNSDVNIRFEATEDGHAIVKGYIQSEVEQTAFNTLIYNDKEAELEVFPLKIEMKSDYNHPQTVNQNFFDGFNKQSRIDLTDNKGVSLGHVRLEQVSGRSRVNLIMYYHDNSSENLEDFMLSVDKILNMKTSFQRW